MFRFAGLLTATDPLDRAPLFKPIERRFERLVWTIVSMMCRTSDTARYVALLEFSDTHTHTHTAGFFTHGFLRVV